MSKSPDFSNFGAEETRDALNALTVAEVIVMLGGPVEHVRYVKAEGWKVGDERPALAHDDPAVMQAVGRCASHRLRARMPVLVPVIEHVAHPAGCDWCEFPLDELVKACAWNVHRSGFVESDVLEWKDKEGRTYLRPGVLTGYQNAEHRRFWELPQKERERRIEAATGRQIAA